MKSLLSIERFFSEVTWRKVMPKIFNDAIHNHMSFEPVLVKLIDTREFQRLRFLKQLGLANCVYPSANHNRFEHSLGTCHLAGKLLNTLIPYMKENEKPTEQEKLCVQIAGLCHDLGHGAFSHTWEIFLRKAGKVWKHEDSSIEILNRLLDKPDVKKALMAKNFTQEHFQLIRDLIIVPENVKTDKYYLYQIISNVDNDIDVDKWDYLLRDQKFLNINTNFDASRLMEYCRVLLVPRDNTKRLEICFRDAEMGGIVSMLLTRAALHEKAYQHRVVKIIEHMVVDAFLAAHEACPEWNMTDTSPEHLITLTDSALYDRIINSGHNLWMPGQKDAKERLTKARNLLIRVEERKLYKCLHTHESCEKELERFPKLTHEDLAKVGEEVYQNISSNNNLENVAPSEIEVVQITVDMGSKYKDGGPNCYVFKKDSFTPTLIEGKRPILWNHLKPVLSRKLLVLYKGDITDENQLQHFRKMAEGVFSNWVVKLDQNKPNASSAKKRKMAKEHQQV